MTGTVIARERVVVWIDSREARFARRARGAIDLVHLESDVPPHTGAGGHVRHDPARHGGAGDAQSAAERRRQEHLERFLADVEDRLPTDADVEVLGPGVVHERLAARLRAHDRRHRRDRVVTAHALDRLTDRQLVARLRGADLEAER